MSRHFGQSPDIRDLRKLSRLASTRRQTFQKDNPSCLLESPALLCVQDLHHPKQAVRQMQENRHSAHAREGCTAELLLEHISQILISTSHRK